MTHALEERKAMSAASINDLPDEDFAYIEPGGEKDEDGKTTPRSLRHFPIHDAAHVRNALARASQSPFGEKAMPKIRKAAQKYGVEVGDRSVEDDSEYRRIVPAVCTRGFDFEIRATRNRGRTLEGYVAVFGATARIADHQGEFDEEIHNGTFDRYLSTRGFPVMQYDHGKDTRVGSLPIGVYEVFEPDHHGYFVRGELLDDPVVAPIAKAVDMRAIKGMSWRMMVPKNGQKWTRRHPDVDKRDVLDADVPEAGPVVFPAYDQTTVSVRSILAAMDAEEIRALAREFAGYLGLATDLTDLTGQPGARSAGGGDDDAQAQEGTASPPHNQSSTETRQLEESAFRALGVL